MPLNNLIILNKVAFTISHDTLRAHDVPHTHVHVHPHISKKMYVKQTPHALSHTFSRTLPIQIHTITAVC